MPIRYLARLACLSTLVLTACGDDGKTSDTTASTTSPSTTGASTDAGTGSSGGTGASSGEAPTTGDASTGGGSGSNAQFCLEECKVDGDCKSMGMDLGLTCQAGACTGSAGGCTENFDCTILLSGWQIPCSPQTPCPPGQACIDIGGGEGRCASTPTPDLPCTVLQQSEYQAMTLDGMPVTVCANTDNECRDNTCVNPCESDADCTFPDLPKCNTNTGQCECSSDADCKTEGRPVCKTTFCGCGVDADCQGPNNPNTDTCYDGACGCGSDTTCTTKSFDGTTISCKKP